VQTVNHFIFVDFNCEFTPAVEAARSQIEDPKQDEEKVGPLRPHQGSEQRDQLDDSRVLDFDRRFRPLHTVALWLRLRDCNLDGDEHCTPEFAH